jgi:HPt (histidine-containing phosphotransfer) domain-containing protein
MLARLLDEFGQVGFPVDADPQAIALYVSRMHKLRGGACMLGATTVYVLAGQVEAACIEGDMDCAAQSAATLTDEIQRLISNAQPVLGASRAEAAKISMSSRVEPDLQLIDELRALLRQQSLLAVDRFKSLSPQLRQFMGNESYERMSVHIDNLRFEGASRELLDSAQPHDTAPGRTPEGITEAAN